MTGNGDILSDNFKEVWEGLCWLSEGRASPEEETDCKSTEVLF